MYRKSSSDSLDGFLAQSRESREPAPLSCTSFFNSISGGFFRIVLLNAYSNNFADNSVTFFVDLFLCFIVAELTDAVFWKILSVYMSAVER